MPKTQPNDVSDNINAIAEQVDRLADVLTRASSDEHLAAQASRIESAAANAFKGVGRLVEVVEDLGHRLDDLTDKVGNLTADDTLDRLAIAMQGKSPYAELAKEPADTFDITDAGAAALEAAADTGVLGYVEQDASPAIALAMLAPDKDVQNASVFDTLAAWADSELRGRLGMASAGKAWDALAKLPSDSVATVTKATADLVELGIKAAMDKYARKRLQREMDFPLSTLANVLALEVAVIRRVLADVMQLAFGVAAQFAVRNLRPVL